MTNKVYIDEHGSLVIEQPNVVHKYGEGHKVVSFRVNGEKDGITTIEECDGYFETTLNRNDIDRLIRKLNLLKKQLKPNRIKVRS